MSDLRFQFRALGDSTSVHYGIASSLVAAAGALLRPVRRSEAGRLAYRTGFAAYTAWELSAWPRDDWQTPSVPFRISMAAGGAALAYRFAESGARLDTWLEDKLCQLGFARPRIVMALGTGALSAAVFLLERHGNQLWDKVRYGWVTASLDDANQDDEDMRQDAAERRMEWNEPSPAHRRLYAEMASVSGEYGRVLENQFANSQVCKSEHCDDGCFEVKITADTPRLPRNAECPIPFNAIDQNTGADDNVMLLLWHKNGLVDDVEISWFAGDSHPPPEMLTVYA
jgi:hypothetical protein